MAYATIADMIARFGESELSDYNQNLDIPRGTLDEERITLALSDASNQIESYLQRRYVVPLRPVTPAIIRACCILARHDLAMGSTTMPSEQMREGRRAILSWLADIGSGKATLDAQIVTEETGNWSRFQCRPTGLGEELW